MNIYLKICEQRFAYWEKSVHAADFLFTNAEVKTLDALY